MEYANLRWDEDDDKKQLFLESLAPIVLFTYNRVEHTKQTIKALQNNVYASDSRLYIYSDAPKNLEAELPVNKIREFLKSVKGFKSVTIIERKENWGLAKNIIDGVTDIVNKYGKIIVLEDDIVTSKYFLKYMNDALEIYKSMDKVASISGFQYPIDFSDFPETFFQQNFNSWGWATWKNRWMLFKREPEKILREFSDEEIFDFDFDDSYDFWIQVKDNCDQRIYTWAIFFYVMSFKYKKVHLFPRQSLVHNIGLDNTGTHCEKTNIYDSIISNQSIKHFSTNIEINKQVHIKVIKFYQNLRPNLLEKVFNFSKRSIKKVLHILNIGTSSLFIILQFFS